MSAFAHPAPESGGPVGETAPAPAPVEPKGRHWWKFGVAAAVLAGGVLAAYQMRPKPQEGAGGPVAGIRTAKAAMDTLVRTVRVSGQSSARNYALMSVPVLRGPESRGSLILLKMAQAGSTVNKGDVVIQLDKQAAQDHMDDHTDQLEQARQDIKKREAEQGVDWGNLQQTLRIASSDFEKATLDYRTAEVKTEVERELLRLNLDEAEATYKQREADVEVTRSGDRAELRILGISYERNKLNVDRHLMDIVRYEMKTPMAGLVVMQPIFRGGEMAQIQEGDQVSPGQQIMKIVDLASMQVEGIANQSESGRLRLGQPATVGLDAFPELRFKGRVHSVGALAIGGRRENFYVRTVPVRVAIEGSDPRLIPDLSAWADVEVERHENVLLIPREAVATEEGQPVVYVRGPSGLEKRAVTLGPANRLRVAVLSGLSAGEEVALSQPQ